MRSPIHLPMPFVTTVTSKMVNGQYLIFVMPSGHWKVFVVESTRLYLAQQGPLDVKPFIANLEEEQAS